jgi:feruloyl esterase
VAIADRKIGVLLNAANPDLRSFRARGGKLLHYHGWGDPSLLTVHSIDYYEAVRSFLSRFPDGNGDRSRPIEEFYRLFLVPGMGHCSANPGDYNFGNNVFHPAARDADHDVLSALERWVEQGIAPDQIIATAPDSSKPTTHPICAYPQTAAYQGKGDANDAVSFRCESTGRTR